MIVASSSRITFDLFAKARLGGEVVHNIFCGGGAADISEADEEEFHGKLGVGSWELGVGSWERT